MGDGEMRWITNAKDSESEKEEEETRFRHGPRPRIQRYLRQLHATNSKEWRSVGRVKKDQGMRDIILIIVDG